jgi:hypothetical protein
MNIRKLIFAACAIALSAVLITVSRSSDSKSTKVYDTAILKSPDLPAWNVTNEVPLPPNKAVKIAMAYAGAHHPKVRVWDCDEIRLSRYTPNTAWFYTIDLIDRASGSYTYETIRVLLNGKVWEPSK